MRLNYITKAVPGKSQRRIQEKSGVSNCQNHIIDGGCRKYKKPQIKPEPPRHSMRGTRALLPNTSRTNSTETLIPTSNIQNHICRMSTNLLKTPRGDYYCAGHRINTK